MPLRCLTLPAFSVIGKMGAGPVRFSSVWVRALWRDCMDELSAVAHLARRGDDGQIPGFWGLMSGVDAYLSPWGEEGRYLAGVEVNPGASPPTGFTLWHMPQRTYLVATCSTDVYQEVYHRLVLELQQSERYRLVGAMQEFYPQTAGQGAVELYLPVEPR